MKTQEFIQHMEEALEVDAGSINMDQLIADLPNWDSLAIMTFIAMVDEQYGVALSGSKISEAKTVQDLFLLIEDKVVV